MTPPLVMNWKMISILVASIDAMKKEARDSCLFLTVVTISGDMLTMGTTS
jgi:hypothetical protein